MVGATISAYPTSLFTDEVKLTSSLKGRGPKIRVVPVTDDELKSILTKLDDVMRQAQEMSAQIRTRLDERVLSQVSAEPMNHAARS